MFVTVIALWSLLALPAPVPAQSPAAAPPGVAAARALQRQGDLEGAVEAWRAIAEANPTSGAAWFELGHALHTAGRLEEAAAAHERAAEFPAFARSALYNLACARALLGATEPALDALERAVEAGFEDKQLVMSDSDLAGLRDEARFQALLVEIERPLSRRLHFWIGEWDCYQAGGGAFNGRNELRARLDGNVIHETWTPAGGGVSGESWNFFDPAHRTWHQHWMSSNGQPSAFVGVPHENGILFEGSGPTGPTATGTSERKRMFVRPIGDQRVQQTGTRSIDDGATWTPEYDLVYVPRGEPYSPATTNVSVAPATAPTPDPAREFDFLLGDWRMDVEQFGPGGERVRKLTEWSHVRRTNAGTTLLDEWEGSGFTIRTWDPRDRVWRLFWTDRQASPGRMQCWEGRFEDGVGTFVGGASLPAVGATRSVSKIEFSEITPTSVLWKMWKSPDDGATWVLDYVRHYTRVSP